MKRQIRIYPTHEAMSHAAALGFVTMSDAVLEAHDYFTVALSGGNTPLKAYRVLAEELIQQVQWDRVQLYWGDERYVPARDRRSNSSMFHEAMLGLVRLPLENVHPMPTHRSDPNKAAEDYERFVRAQSSREVPRFDLVMLGMGDDGHIASLFPGSPALDEDKRFIVATEAPAEPKTRLTMTYPLLNAAAHVCILVSGSNKANILAEVLQSAPDKHRWPVTGIDPSDGDLMWWLDEDAATELDESVGERYDVVRMGA